MGMGFEEITAFAMGHGFLPPPAAFADPTYPYIATG
jgi:hypothetical protein